MFIQFPVLMSLILKVLCLPKYVRPFSAAPSDRAPGQAGIHFLIGCCANCLHPKRKATFIGWLTL